MNVYQLSIAYVPEQDRILVRINTQEGKELQFWLTRRLSLGLSPVLDKVATEHTARHGAAGLAPAQVVAMDDLSKKAVAEFQRTETLKHADFATPYKASPTNTPMFPQPLLVTEVNITPLPNGQLRLACGEKLPGTPPDAQRQFQLALSQQLTHAFMHLLEQALVQSQWREAPGASVLRSQQPPEPALGGDKPTYLN